MDKSEIEKIKILVKQIEDAKNNPLFDDPWFDLVRHGAFDYPNLIK